MGLILLLTLNPIQLKSEFLQDLILIVNNQRFRVQMELESFVTYPYFSACTPCPEMQPNQAVNSLQSMFLCSKLRIEDGFLQARN